MQSHPKQYQQIAQNKVKSRESTIEGGDVDVEGGNVRHRGRLHRGRHQWHGISIEGGDGAASREAVTA
jgi:hypothetical protein